MDAEFSPQQEELRASVRRLLADHAPLTSVRSWFDRPAEASAVPSPVWQSLAELGVVGLLAPADRGGSGATLVDLAVVLEEIGRAVLPGPFLSTAVGATLALRSLDVTDAAGVRLAGLASGSVIGTVALAPAEVQTGAQGGRTGIVRYVPDAAAADLLLLALSDPARGPEDLEVVAVHPSMAGVRIEACELVDPTRRFGHVHLDGAMPIQLDDDATAYRAVIDRLLVAWILDGIGAAEAALALAVTYAQNRRQFGAPIGSFQAVQHLCADMLRDLEVTRGAAYYAAWAADAADADQLDESEAHRAATMARAAATESLTTIGAGCIQVHGGIGFTWEHDAHLFHKRLLTLQQVVAVPGHPLDDLATIVL